LRRDVGNPLVRRCEKSATHSLTFEALFQYRLRFNIIYNDSDSYGFRDTAFQGRAMLSKTFSWIIIVVVVTGVIWWMVDPAGFSQNPVINFFRGLSGWTPGRR
jgi:hypothetical protein